MVIGEESALTEKSLWHECQNGDMIEGGEDSSTEANLVA